MDTRIFSRSSAAAGACSVLFCSSAVLHPRVGHTMNVLSIYLNETSLTGSHRSNVCIMIYDVVNITPRCMLHRETYVCSCSRVGRVVVVDKESLYATASGPFTTKSTFTMHDSYVHVMRNSRKHLRAMRAFLARDVIYTSRDYATMSVSVCL